MTGRPPVAVAVVSWNTRDLLEACLRSLEPDMTGGRAEVWVLDNASSDGSAELVRTTFPWVNLIASEENLGFGAAVNEIAGRTTNPWVAPANADVELTPGALERLLATGELHPRAGVVAPRLVLPDGTVQHSVYAFPTLPFTVLFNLGVWRLSERLADRLTLEGHWDHRRSRRVDWAIGALVIVRRAAWDEVGGFDSGQWMYAEDLDLGWRLAQAGWETRYEPQAEVRHEASAATSQAWGEDRTKQWMWSTYAWMLRRRGIARTRLTALVNIAGALVRVAILTLPARLRPARWDAARSAFAGWAHLHRIGLARRETLSRHS